MDTHSQMTRPYGHEQAEDPIRIHHPEEEEHHEKGATKVLKKVKEKAKKIKNSLTKHGHGHEHDHDVDEEDYEYDEQDPEVHGAPVYESFVVRGGVTGQPESLPGDNVPAPEEIIPPGTKVFPVVSSDYTKPVDPEPLQDASYRHDAPYHPVRMSDKEERRREATTHLLGVSDLSDRGESREAHQETMNTPASLLSTTEDLTMTFAPGEDEYLGGQRKVNIETPKRFQEDPAATEDVTMTFAPGEDEYLGGQRKVNIERPRGLEKDPAAPGGGSDYLSGVSNYQSKVTDPTHKGGGEAGVPEIAESLGRMKVTDESPSRKSGLGFEKGLTTRGYESGIGKDSPAGFGGEDFAVGKDSSTLLGSASTFGLGEDFPARSHESGLKNESGIGKNSPSGFGRESGAGLREEFPARNHELGLKNESGIKDSATRSHGYGEEFVGAGPEKNFLARTDDVKVETGLGRELPTGTHDQFSPELSRPKERDDFSSKAEESRDETLAPKPSTYTEKIASATSVISDKAIAAKNAVASRLGYSGESGGGEGQHERSLREVTPRSDTGYGDKVAGKLSRPKERDHFSSKAEETRDETHLPKPSTYTEKIASATSVISNKAVAAKNAVASKLGYSGESGGGEGQHETPLRSSGQHESSVEEVTPRSATGYGQKVAGTVAEKLTPVYEKVKETGSTVMTKLPLSGGGSGAEKQQGVSTRDYLAGKLRPGEEDRALSEVIAEKLHLGGGEKKNTTTTTKEVEVTVEKIPSDKIPEEVEREHGDVVVVAEEGKGEGMVGKLKGAVTSWLGGTTEEAKPKSSDSAEESSQSLGSTVGTKGFSHSGGVVETQRELKKSGN